MILSYRDCDLLLQQIYRPPNVTKQQQKLIIRNCAMVVFMLDAGLRITELVDLIIDNLMVHEKPREVLYITRGLPRGHAERAIPLVCRVRSLIETMNKWWWISDAEVPGYFAFYNRTPAKHITTRQVQRIINQAALDALGYPVKPNDLRRTCAARLLRKTNLRTVQKLLDYKVEQKSFFYR